MELNSSRYCLISIRRHEQNEVAEFLVEHDAKQSEFKQSGCLYIFYPHILLIYMHNNTKATSYNKHMYTHAHTHTHATTIIQPHVQSARGNLHFTEDKYVHCS